VLWDLTISSSLRSSPKWLVSTRHRAPHYETFSSSLFIQQNQWIYLKHRNLKSLINISLKPYMKKWITAHKQVHYHLTKRYQFTLLTINWNHAPYSPQLTPFSKTHHTAHNLHHSKTHHTVHNLYYPKTHHTAHKFYHSKTHHTAHNLYYSKTHYTAHNLLYFPAYKTHHDFFG
jgi:hypothetical protein